MKIGVFDSGVGGKRVADSIGAALPDATIIFANDSEHVPYGTKTTDEIHDFVVPILENLVAQGCEVIVIACNTVTTTMIEDLRSEIKVPLVGMEPMIKPAARMSVNHQIAVCATPATLKSKRYAWLKQQYGKGILVHEPDCSDWASMIEQNAIDERRIHERLNEVIEEGADVIVLGCTHYHWIEEEIKEIAAGRAQVIQPEHAVINELKRVIARLA